MTYNEKETDTKDSTSKIFVGTAKQRDKHSVGTDANDFDPLSALESDFATIEHKHPRLVDQETKIEARSTDLRAVLEISKAINSTLILDDILQMVMKQN